MAIVFHPITPPTDEELMQLHELNGGYSVERLAEGGHGERRHLYAQVSARKSELADSDRE